MRQELNDNEMNNVVGGTVIISYDYMKIGFDTLKEMYDLKNCTYFEATAFRDELIINHKQMTNQAFDEYCKAQFQAKGWI